MNVTRSATPGLRGIFGGDPHGLRDLDAHTARAEFLRGRDGNPFVSRTQVVDHVCGTHAREFQHRVHHVVGRWEEAHVGPPRRLTCLRHDDRSHQRDDEERRFHCGTSRCHVIRKMTNSTGRIGATPTTATIRPCSISSWVIVV
jgi:hypothetical protein